MCTLFKLPINTPVIKKKLSTGLHTVPVWTVPSSSGKCRRYMSCVISPSTRILYGLWSSLTKTYGVVSRFLILIMAYHWGCPWGILLINTQASIHHAGCYSVRKTTLYPTPLPVIFKIICKSLLGLCCPPPANEHLPTPGPLLGTLFQNISRRLLYLTPSDNVWTCSFCVSVCFCDCYCAATQVKVSRIVQWNPLNTFFGGNWQIWTC
jgi:hypothetical protein